MGREEDVRNARRDALLAMHAQTGEAQKPPAVKPPEMQPPRDLAQMRPVVQNTVTGQEKRAEQVVNATWKLFQTALG